MYNTITTPWYESIKEGQSLHTAIAILPQYLREAVGTIQYPDDNGMQLVDELINTYDVHSWSDGTVKDAKGAHAYTIRPSNDDDKKSVVGTGMTPSDVTSLTSLRTEHYGALGVVIIVTCLIKIHGIKEPIKGITHHIDSLTVRDRLQKRLDPYTMNDKTLGGTDFDVWAETDKLLREPNIIITYQHVKGHQADTLQEQYGMRGPLQREAHYNEVCDTIAGNTRISHDQPFHTSMFPASKIGVFTGETYVTANVYDTSRRTGRGWRYASSNGYNRTR